MASTTTWVAGALVVTAALAVGGAAVYAAVRAAPPAVGAMPKPATGLAAADMEAPAGVLAAALSEAGAKDRSPGERVNILATAADEVAKVLGDGWLLSARLKEAATTARAGVGVEAGAAEAAETLTRVVRGAERDLRFRPKLDAPLPPNWPAFTPPGEVEIKEYPTYRAAFTTRKPMLFRQSRNFMTLFRHISSRDIPMTTPVEMPMKVGESGELYETSMAFMYPDQQTGAVGKTDEGAVEVVDVPATTVIGTAFRGKLNETRIKAGHDRLQAWLKANEAKYVAVGEPRVLGWNDPSTPDERAYGEVQIPIRAK